MLLYCEKFGSQRLLLKTKIHAIWQESKKFGNLPFDLRLLLNPFSSKLNLVEAGEVSKALDHFGFLYHGEFDVLEVFHLY